MTSTAAEITRNKMIATDLSTNCSRYHSGQVQPNVKLKFQNNDSTITNLIEYIYRRCNISLISRLIPATVGTYPGQQSKPTHNTPKIELTYRWSTRIHLLISCIKLIAIIGCLGIGHSSRLNIFSVEATRLNQDAEIVEPFIRVRDGLLPLQLLAECPERLSLTLFGQIQNHTIELVKNKRLISQRYFDIAKKKRDDSLSKTPSNDEFHRNHLFLNLHNISSNDDHCHYHGLDSGDEGNLSAISIVRGRSLSGLYLYYETNKNGTVRGTMQNSSLKSVFYLHPDLDLSRTLRSRMPLSRGSLQEAIEGLKSQQGIDIDAELIRKQTRSRVRRSAKSTISGADNAVLHDPFQSNSSSLYVELLVVHDHSLYLEYQSDAGSIAERTMQIVNIMNAFYRQLNIFIGLVGVVLWVERDEIALTEDGDSTLTSFLKYRYEKLLPKYHHDNAQLITNTSFNGSVVGKALRGPICTHEHSGGVNTDHSHNAAIVAVTLAHELGHNFGMEHDEEDKCRCPDEKCIMSSSSNNVHPKHWSSCSVEQLDESRRHGLLDCLSNRPTKLFGPICGNGFVEQGEDCDPGVTLPVYGSSKSRSTKAPNSGCSGPKCFGGLLDPLSSLAGNPCCDRRTCRFRTNATCAQGACCDLKTCSVWQPNNEEPVRVCRTSQSVCDLEEVCDSVSEHCPADLYYHDGIPCSPLIGTPDSSSSSSQQANQTKAYCFEGKCASHESQCRLLWGPTGSKSRDICFEHNIHGNTSGNCGYKRGEKIFDTCREEDAICGMLHCVHNQPPEMPTTPQPGSMTTGAPLAPRKTGKLNYGFESASFLTVSFFIMSNGAKIYCNAAIVDAGPDAQDPGLVPNGAACGTDQMCLDRRCVPIQTVIEHNWCPSDCNGNGVCDNTGVCHCNDGTIGTSCYQFFGPNFHLSLILYVLAFFLPMGALLVFAFAHYKRQVKLWWYLHKRKENLKHKSQQHQSHLKLHLTAEQRSQLTISEPIPLNSQSNPNRPFFNEPRMLNGPLDDPWKETSCATTSIGIIPADDDDFTLTDRPIGFRLEPIIKQ